MLHVVTTSLQKSIWCFRIPFAAKCSLLTSQQHRALLELLSEQNDFSQEFVFCRISSFHFFLLSMCGSSSSYCCFQSSSQLLQRFVPWIAVASANCVNIPLTRQKYDFSRIILYYLLFPCMFLRQSFFSFNQRNLEGRWTAGRKRSDSYNI